MSNDLKDAISFIQRKRAAAMALVQKYDAALKLLRELDGDATEEASHTVLVAEPRVIPPPSSGLSVMEKVRRLGKEADRAWTASQIIEEYDRRGDPMTAADPRNAVRTALAALTKRGEMYRVGEGVYKSTKWQHREPEESRGELATLVLRTAEASG